MKSPLLERVCGPILSKSACALVALTGTAMSVMAQDDELRPPTTTDAPSSPKFVVIGVAVLLLGLVVVVATLKSKRGHQD